MLAQNREDLGGVERRILFTGGHHDTTTGGHHDTTTCGHYDVVTTTWSPRRVQFSCCLRVMVARPVLVKGWCQIMCCGETTSFSF